MLKTIAAAGVLGLGILVGTSAQASYSSNSAPPQGYSVAPVVLALNPQPLPPGEKKKVQSKKRYHPAKRTR